MRTTVLQYSGVNCTEIDVKSSPDKKQYTEDDAVTGIGFGFLIRVLGLSFQVVGTVILLVVNFTLQSFFVTPHRPQPLMASPA